MQAGTPFYYSGSRVPNLLQFKAVHHKAVPYLLHHSVCSENQEYADHWHLCFTISYWTDAWVCGNVPSCGHLNISHALKDAAACCLDTTAQPALGCRHGELKLTNGKPRHASYFNHEIECLMGFVAMLQQRDASKPLRKYVRSL